MKVVIAGGTGLIGRALSRSLIADGVDVVVLTRGDPRSASKVPGVRMVTWRPPESGRWTAELRGADAVVNLAGASIGRWPWTRARMRLLRDSRLGSTAALVAALADLASEDRPRTLVSASGTDLYEGRDAVPADEATSPADSYLARLSLDWEAQARRAESLGVRVVLARTSSVVAHDAPFLRVVSLPVRLGFGKRIGTGSQWVSWIDIADVVGLYRFAMATPAVAGPLNVTAPDPRRQREFAAALAATLDRWNPLWAPGWSVRLILGPQALVPLGSRRVWPAKALAAGYRFLRPRLEDSLRAAVRGVPVDPAPAGPGAAH